MVIDSRSNHDCCNATCFSHPHTTNRHCMLSSIVQSGVLDKIYRTCQIFGAYCERQCNIPDMSNIERQYNIPDMSNIEKQYNITSTSSWMANEFTRSRQLPSITE